MKKTNKLIPELRFPEFEEDGDWVEESLDNLTTKISDGIHTTPNYDNVGEYYFINGNNLIDGKIWIDEKTKRVSKEEYNIHKRDLGESTIFLSINGTIGNIAVYNNEKVILGKSACYINVNDLKINKIFVKYFIQTESAKSYFHSELTGSTIQNLSLKSIKETIIKVPNNPIEQQKIASCLSSLDELITSHNQKLETLKDHKKGLMQNLFPQEGETAPKYRFPEFEEDGDWLEKELNEACEINPKVSQLPVQFVYIDLESVKDGILLKKKTIKRKGAPSRAQRLLIGNDVIFQMVRPYQKNNYYFSKIDDLDYVASTGYAQLRSFESSMYLYQFIHTDRFIGKVLKKCTGSNYPAINSSDLSQISVQMPMPKEQHKIASCLSSLDELITAQEEKIEQLQLHKKGLMQGLFPKIERR